MGSLGSLGVGVGVEAEMRRMGVQRHGEEGVHGYG